VTPRLLALQRASDHIVVWLEQLESRLAGGDPEIRREYVSLAATLATITAQLTPEATGQALTTAGLAERLQLSPRTIRRYKKIGKLTPLLNGGAVRWSTR
jgi:hypothetical protein